MDEDKIAEAKELDHLRRLETITKKKFLKYQRERHLRFVHGEDLSTSEDEDGNKKSGYELTEYMKEYNANTRKDFTKGNEPKKLDDDYKNFKNWDKKTKGVF